MLDMSRQLMLDIGPCLALQAKIARASCARVAAELAAAAFSHVLGEGAAAPGRPWITAVCMPSAPCLLEFDPVRGMSARLPARLRVSFPERHAIHPNPDHPSIRH
jgi:hypothetical protein